MVTDDPQSSKPDVGTGDEGSAVEASIEPAASAERESPPDPKPADDQASRSSKAPRSTERSASWAGRLIDWFWLGSAFRRLHSQTTFPTRRSRELRRRALLSAEVADRILEPSEPLDNGPGTALGCELYRQSIFWSLAALVELAEPPTNVANRVSEPKLLSPSAENLRALWQSIDPEVLRQAAGGDEELASLGRYFAGQDFVVLAELKAEEQSPLASQLRQFSSALVARTDPLRAEQERLWTARITRIALLVGLVLVLGFGGYKAWDSARWGTDLAAGAAWTASSKYPVGGCTSPAQSCGDKSEDYFFCTNEEFRPWIEFDLGRVTNVSGINVLNREEVSDRAVPLVVQVSTDHKHWKEVARRTTDFDRWKVRFPTERARWVKLYVAKRTFLHLRQVKIAP